MVRYWSHMARREAQAVAHLAMNGGSATAVGGSVGLSASWLYTISWAVFQRTCSLSA
jgi:hypothetical protein